MFVFAALSFLGDVQAIRQSLLSFGWGTLGVALLLVLGNYGLRFLRWQYYLRLLGVSVPTGLSALVFTAGFVMSVTPGKMGEVFKSWLLYEYRQIRVARTASIVVAERLLDLVALVVLVSAGSAAFERGRAVAVVGAAVVAGVVAVCTVRPLGEWLLSLLARIRWVSRIVPRLREAYDALSTLTRPRALLVGSSYAIAGWALECVAALILVRGFEDAVVRWEAATFSYAAGTLAGAIAMLPGGLGVAEVGMSGLLRATSPSLSIETAAAATILIRLSTLWFGVALGGLALIILRRAMRPARL